MKKRISIIALCIALFLSMTPLPGLESATAWADTSDGGIETEGLTLSSIDTAEVILLEDTFVYDGQAPHPGVIVSLDGITLVEGEDYELLYDESSAIGEHTVLITGIGEYGGTATATYRIVKRQQVVTVTEEFNKYIDDSEFDLGAVSDGDGILVYGSDNTSVAVVDSNGTVRIRGIGEAHLTVYAKESDVCERSENVDIVIHVTKHVPAIYVTESYAKQIGDAPFSLDAVTDSDGELYYTSSDPSVATVDAAGLITINRAGTTEITIGTTETSQFEGAEKTVLVSVGKLIPELTITSNYQKTIDDEPFAIDVASNSDGQLVFSSSDPEVASVDEVGIVTIHKSGTVQVSVYSEETDFYSQSPVKSATIKVAKKTPTLTVTSSYSKTYGNSPFKIKATTSSDGSLVFSSSNKSIATVDSAGKVTIKKAGTVKISVYSKATDTYAKSTTKTVTIKIAKATQKVTVTSKYTKTIGNAAFIVKASTNGDGKLKYSSNNKKVATVSSAGKVTIKGVGTAKITVYAAAGTNYKKSASKTITITVNPKKVSLSSVKNSDKNKLTVKWKKGSSINGYQLQYSAKSDFSKSKKVIVSKNTTVEKTLSGLTKGYTYYVRVRTFKTVNGTKYYSSWSSKKSVKVSKGNVRYFTKIPKITLKGTEDLVNTVSWKKLSGASGYQVSYKKGDNGSWTTLKKTTALSVKHSVKHGYFYYYRVRAYQDLADGSRIYSKYSNIKDLIQYYDPDYSTFMLSDSDSSTDVVPINITNNGVARMRVYAKNAYLIDEEYESFDRYSLFLIDSDANIKSYIDIPAGKSVTFAFVVDGAPTWYDEKTRIFFSFKYDGVYYRANASSYYGSIWWLDDDKNPF